MNKRFMENARDKAKVLLLTIENHAKYSEGTCDCSLCINVAELRKIAEWCWHERSDISLCIHCGTQFLGIVDSDEHWDAEMNPTFDIPTIRHTMEVLGLWREFTSHLRKSIDETVAHNYRYWWDTMTGVDILMPDDIVDMIANILTDTELLLQAVNEYMGRE